MAEEEDEDEEMKKGIRACHDALLLHSSSSCSRPSSAAWLAAQQQLMALVQASGPLASPHLLRLLRQPHLPDCLLDALAQAIAQCCGSVSAPPAVRTFTFSPSLRVQVKEMDYVQGGLGWKVWGAALVLSWRLIGLQEILRGKRVLELGSGCGLCGLLVAKLGAAEVVLSDCTPEILSNLCTNVSYLWTNKGGKSYDSTLDNSQGYIDLEETELVNDGQKYVKTSHQDMYIETARQKVDTPGETSCLVRVCFLDWLEDSSIVESQPLKSSSKDTACFPKLDTEEKFDWVIGSDLIYDDYSLQSLVDVIYRHLPNKDGHGLFVCPIRDRRTLDLFVKELDRWGMAAKIENISDLEWSNCTSALNDAVATRAFFGHGESTLHGIDHYEGGMVVISVTHKEPGLE